MIALLKDRYKLGLLMATIFFGGILVSLFTAWSLSDDLMIGDPLSPAFIRLYSVLGLTFLIGATAIYLSLTHRQEVIVFREKQLDRTEAVKEQADASRTTISLEEVRNNLKQSRSIKDVLSGGLHAICKQLEAGQGAIYLTETTDGVRKLHLKSGYALNIGESTVVSYEFGEGLIGQAAAGARTLYVDDIPEGYIKIVSGLGSASPRHLLISPMKNDNEVVGIVEIASFSPISDDERKFIEESGQLIAATLKNHKG